jgi:hypothetical protein
VALSRGRYDAQVFTDNKTMLGHNLTRDVSHRAAPDPPRHTVHRDIAVSPA